jgi:hypothetical protein
MLSRMLKLCKTRKVARIVRLSADDSNKNQIESDVIGGNSVMKAERYGTFEGKPQLAFYADYY